MNIAHPKFLKLSDKLQSSVDSYLKIKVEVLCEQDINPNSTPLDVVNFTRHISHNGTIQKRRNLMKASGKPMCIHNQHIAFSLDGFKKFSKPN
jgi:hypothetical protein